MKKNNVQNDGKILNGMFSADQKDYMQMLYFSLRYITGPVSFVEIVNSCQWVWLSPQNWIYYLKGTLKDRVHVNKNWKNI